MHNPAPCDKSLHPTSTGEPTILYQPPDGFRPLGTRNDKTHVSIWGAAYRVVAWVVQAPLTGTHLCAGKGVGTSPQTFSPKPRNSILKPEIPNPKPQTPNPEPRIPFPRSKPRTPTPKAGNGANFLKGSQASQASQARTPSPFSSSLLLSRLELSDTEALHISAIPKPRCIGVQSLRSKPSIVNLKPKISNPMP